MLNKVVEVYSHGTGHIQGIAIDKERKYMYCSFTTEFAKFDMGGNLVGSVKGLLGHLGCIAYNYDNGCVYGSLEYKNDSIGKWILRFINNESTFKDAFYVAKFDVDKIDRVGMDAEKDGVMRTIYMDEVTSDYSYPGHKYGCSGIDGITFAPMVGDKQSKNRLYLSYGIYGDVNRTDNDYQIILSFDVDKLDSFARVMSQDNMHTSGPKPDNKYFVFTGNTVYGVQNLEYDPYTNSMFMFVYRGQKECYPNYSLYAIDMDKKPETQKLIGMEETGEVIFLKKQGLYDEKSGIYGYNFKYGSTGAISLGNGKYYFSQNREDYTNKEFFSSIRLYSWDGKEPFTLDWY